ncbi:MAG: TRAP transporter small permease subunit [Haliea sp.]|uniref:TRAP transporter small permease subunit n=1 Tax=Haliea sp. TaxID=1932666 RepID=UPI0032F09773
MALLTLAVHTIDRFTETCGRFLAWLLLAMALLTAAVVLLRYGFNTGSIMAQEAITYLHGCVFMLGAAYTLKHDGHVRVDIFYRRFSPRGQAWINAIGGIVFLLPMCGFILVSSWDYVEASWIIRETSAEAGGIPAVFLLKTLLPLLAINLFLQALAETLRNASVLVGGRG